MERLRLPTINLSLGNATLFTTLRNPNDISPFRSSQLPAQGSETMVASSSSSQESSKLHNASILRTDSSSIDNVPRAQTARSESRAAIALEKEAKMIQVSLQTILDRQTRQDPRRSKMAELRARRSSRRSFPISNEDIIDLTSSPSSVIATTDVQSQDTGQPITPHAIGSTPFAWSPSPLARSHQQSSGTSGRKRQAFQIAVSESDSEAETPLPEMRRDKGKGRAPSPDVHMTRAQNKTSGETGKGGWTEPDEYDTGFDDFADIDFESLSTIVDPRISPLNPDPTSTTHTSGNPLDSVSANHHPSLGKASDFLGIPMLSQLSEEEQEFYRNHWRRGADRAEERREAGARDKPVTAAVERKKPVYARRGGFRGRGRGRGTGNRRKR